MADVETVAVREPCDQLAEDANSFRFRESAVGGDVVEEFASLDILKDKVPGSWLDLAFSSESYSITYNSPLFSQTSYRLMMFGCSINFMMTTSLSIPNGINLLPLCAIVSMTAKLVLRNSSADFLLTILMAASCPVMACLAFLTLPEAPLPIVFPSRHGPTWVLRLDLPEALVEALDIWESRLEC